MSEVATPPRLWSPPRPWRKRMIMILRRGHLYFGLFLFPWAILYGVTALLFNHPTLLSDQRVTTFRTTDTVGTPLETLSTPEEVATQVVARLNAVQKPTAEYQRVGPAELGPRDSAFATVQTAEGTVSLLFDMKHGGGSVRVTNVGEKRTPQPAPFAVSLSRPAPTPEQPPPPEPPRLQLDYPWDGQIAAAVPTLLARLGYPTGPVVVTSVPDVVFNLEANGQTWRASYNAKTASVTGTLANELPEASLSTRRFFLRLHTAHGYPSATNEQWAWALMVDAMAVTLCFWGVTGLIMWWQIKATRRLGTIIMIFSAVWATLLGTAMYSAMTQ